MESTRPIRALMRGLDALAVLNLRDGATVSEVVGEIRLPRTTVYRILETLCDAGFAYRDGTDDRYRLSAQVRGLSEGFDDEGWVSRVAKPAIDRLGEDIVWPVAIATLHGGAMVVRETTDHASPLASLRYSAGCRLPLVSSASGLIHLAHCAATERDALIAALAKSNRPEDRPARAPEELLARLDAVRAEGHAVGASHGRDAGETTVAVPVQLAQGASGALSVRFAAADLPLNTALERFLPKLRACADGIRQAISEQQAATGVSSTLDSAA